ncbi:MAG: 2-dehydropantoate 2-reductase N-terminal domain-containing protein, partial [Dehalococcoidia bacterium]|nr:2-dehydropantoate 2-reductase N-terminal domain-containing protein [Dehalococcoidia bacterium]
PEDLVGRFSRIVLAVKAHHTRQATNMLLPHLDKNGYVLSAQNGLNEMIDSLTFHNPLIPLIGNVTAKALKTAEDVREELRLQLTSCVQWNDTIKLMLHGGINDFYEIGHGRILSGMVKRIDRKSKVANIDDFTSVLAYASAS